VVESDLTSTEPRHEPERSHSSQHAGLGVTDHLPSEKLSVELRIRTAGLHRQAEQQLNLPDAVSTCSDYRHWLAGFFGFYQPLEAKLAAFPDWDGLGISIASRLHASAIAHDLAALGTDSSSVPQAAADLLPELPTIAHGLGALYVLEGATLGGQIILRGIEARPGLSIGPARQFFGGRGRDLGPMWNDFRERLDGYGRLHPLKRNDVVAGAQRTFQSLLRWFAADVSRNREFSHGY